MSVHLNEELLSAFLDGEVTAEERSQIESQLAESPDWQRRYRQLVETVNLVRTLPQAPLEKDFSRGILAAAQSRQSSVRTSSGASEAMVAKVLQQPASPNPAGISRSDRSTTDHSRKRSRPTSPILYVIAACAVFVLGIGLVYQSGLFSGNQTQIADQSLEQPVPENVASRGNLEAPGSGSQAEIGPAPEAPVSRFPTVEELAQDQTIPPSSEMDAPAESDPPIGLNIRVRRKPNEMRPETNVPASPGVLARSSMQLDRQDDLGFDQLELPRINSAEVAEELSGWLDTNDDGRVSDLEAQQAWSRFIQPSGTETPLNETVLSAIDQNDNEKLTPAELHAVVASLRWYKGETGESLRKFWHRLDANGDLVWSSDDFPANRQWAGARTGSLEQNLNQWHTLVDRSHDGKATALEFALSADLILQNLKAWEQLILNPKSYQATRALLDTYDRDRNDAITGRELRRFLQDEATLAESMGEIPTRGFTAYELYLAIEAQEIQ